jgi:hypothetical protein
MAVNWRSELCVFVEQNNRFIVNQIRWGLSFYVKETEPFGRYYPLYYSGTLWRELRLVEEVGAMLAVHRVVIGGP